VNIAKGKEGEEKKREEIELAIPYVALRNDEGKEKKEGGGKKESSQGPPQSLFTETKKKKKRKAFSPYKPFSFVAGCVDEKRKGERHQLDCARASGREGKKGNVKIKLLIF